MVKSILLLFCSNIFMTYAWYGNLKNSALPLWKLILLSWGVAFLEYVFMVPANRIGYNAGMSGFQLKITQEVISLIVFMLFSVLYLREPFEWRYLLSFVLIFLAVFVMFYKN